MLWRGKFYFLTEREGIPNSNNTVTTLKKILRGCGLLCHIPSIVDEIKVNSFCLRSPASQALHGLSPQCYFRDFLRFSPTAVENAARLRAATAHARAAISVSLPPKDHNMIDAMTQTTAKAAADSLYFHIFDNCLSELSHCFPDFMAHND